MLLFSMLMLMFGLGYLIRTIKEEYEYRERVLEQLKTTTYQHNNKEEESK